MQLKAEKDVADEVGFKDMQITQSWTGKGSLDMTDESQLNQVRVHLEWFISKCFSPSEMAVPYHSNLRHTSTIGTPRGLHSEVQEIS